MSVAFRKLTNEQLDREMARVSEGFCRFCEVPLLPTDTATDFDHAYRGCPCCGYQMFFHMVHLKGEDAPSICTTGWPKGVGGVPNVGKCKHVAEWDDKFPDEIGYANESDPYVD
jgi:hypothetical protein